MNKLVTYTLAVLAAIIFIAAGSQEAFSQSENGGKTIIHQTNKKHASIFLETVVSLESSNEERALDIFRNNIVRSNSEIQSIEYSADRKSVLITHSKSISSRALKTILDENNIAYRLFSDDDIEQSPIIR